MGEEEKLEETATLRSSPQQQQQQQQQQQEANPSISLPKFDPSRMIGIIRRKALIKDLAAAYHAECLDYCQELLELQRKWEETYTSVKPEDSRKEMLRPPKRVKKIR